MTAVFALFALLIVASVRAQDGAVVVESVEYTALKNVIQSLRAW